jgi:hypothetical protein
LRPSANDFTAESASRCLVRSRVHPNAPTRPRVPNRPVREASSSSTKADREPTAARACDARPSGAIAPTPSPRSAAPIRLQQSRTTAPGPVPCLPLAGLDEPLVVPPDLWPWLPHRLTPLAWALAQQECSVLPDRRTGSRAPEKRRARCADVRRVSVASDVRRKFVSVRSRPNLPQRTILGRQRAADNVDVNQHFERPPSKRRSCSLGAHYPVSLGIGPEPAQER